MERGSIIDAQIELKEQQLPFIIDPELRKVLLWKPSKDAVARTGKLLRMQFDLMKDFNKPSIYQPLVNYSQKD